MPVAEVSAVIVIRRSVIIAEGAVVGGADVGLPVDVLIDVSEHESSRFISSSGTAVPAFVMHSRLFVVCPQGSTIPGWLRLNRQIFTNSIRSRGGSVEIRIDVQSTL